MSAATAPTEAPPETAQAVLECTHLVRRFGDRTAVDDVTLTVAPGETYGLLGPNGAGKTTTIRMACGLLRPDSGTVHVAGRPVGTGTGPAKRLIGYVPQEVALYADLSVRENLRFFGRLYRLPRRRLDRRVDEVLELTDLTSRAGDRVDSLSGGMRRRLNIGAGLVHSPTLLVLDEPTVGVDPQSRHAGGGRAALRPRRHHRPRPPGRRGHPATAPRCSSWCCCRSRSSSSSAPWSAASTNSGSPSYLPRPGPAPDPSPASLHPTSTGRTV
ncbi:ABC transporter ATP-binding protein [Streptomyces sp. NBC_01537]|uniref:ABC transporter ATP-binding protein n=1 Tax=Streptomyces sp. NBC_01537 TaxID=2903896 RepID=UPI00386AAED3